LKKSFEKNSQEQYEANKKLIARVEEDYNQTFNKMKKDFFEMMLKKDNELKVKYFY